MTEGPKPSIDLTTCAHELFELQARRVPGRVAVSFEGAELTYGELNRRANELAHHLRDLGVGPETLVGVSIDRSLELIVALLGVHKAGGAYVPIDPAYPRDRIAFMLEDSRVAVVLVRSGHEVAPVQGRHVVDIDAIPSDGARVENPKSGVTPKNLAYVLYTSGSTGTPKGVQVEHISLTNLLQSMRADPGVTESDVLLAVTSVSFDMSELEIHLPLAVGARVVLASTSVARDGAALAEAIELSRATVMQATPSTWQMLISAGWKGGSSLRALTGGEPLSQRLAGQLLDRCAKLWNLYGPTETTIYSTFTQVVSASAPMTIGLPIANTEVYILGDASVHGAPATLASGSVGELCIGGVGVARGYQHQAALTDEKFIGDPFRGGGARLYRTGDQARQLPDGRIELLGRMDRQMKVRGARVEPGEIEAALAQHPSVKECVVVGQPAANGTTRLAAFLVLASPAPQESALDPTEKWQKVWSEVYRKAAADADEETRRIAGWNDSATGLPMKADEMDEWAGATAARILELRPRRVLEIGCGNGLVLKRVAPHCTSYVGIDITQEAVTELRQSLHGDAQWAHVEVRQGSAEEIGSLAAGTFDCIVINSVLQYFPDVAYAMRVLESALQKVEPGGAVFVGDVRSLALLEAFHLSLELSRAPETSSVHELRQRVREGVLRENELVVDTGLFTALAASNANVASVDVRLKRGRHGNEMTRFRYDAILRTGPKAPRAERERTDWREASLSLETLGAWLAGDARDRRVVARVPNARVARELQALAAIASSRPPATVGALKALLASTAPAAVDPEDVCRAGEALGFDVQIAPSDEPGLFDATFMRRSRTTRTSSVPHAAEVARGRIVRPWSAYANNPAHATIGPRLARTMRAFLLPRLPEAMIPSHFVVIDQMPRAPTGKLDVAALASFDVAATVRRDTIAVAPTNATERLLLEIWEDVLGIDGIGVNDDFRELGGDSLLAVEVTARLEAHLGKKISLGSVFGAHGVTIAKQAEVLRNHEQSSANRVGIVPLQPEGTRPPLFFAATPMNLVRHLRTDQPLYNVNLPPVHQHTYAPAVVNDAIDECVVAIRRLQPRGPYFLGGNCFGALLMLDVAVRLQSLKEEVALLVLVDPDPEDNVPIATRIVHQLREVKGLSVRKKAAFLREKTGSLIRTLRDRARGGGDTEEAAYGELYNARWGTSERTYSFPTALLLSRPKYDRQNQTSAWERRALRKLTIVDLPGDRVTAFSEPHVRVTAEALTRCLDLAQHAARELQAEGADERDASSHAAS